MIYTLIVTTALLLVAAAAVALRDRRIATGLLGAAVLSSIVTAVIFHERLSTPIGPKGYARVRLAAARDPGTDAAAQTALSDNVITASEYVAIAETYQKDTGRDINQEKTR